MARRKKEVTRLEFTDGEVIEIAGSIRDLALDQMEGGLRGLGISEKDIAEARKECIRVNNDRPFMDLMKKVIVL